MVVILGWAKYFGPKPPAHPNNADQAAQTAPATPGNPFSTNAPNTTNMPSVVSAAPLPNVPVTAETQERTIVVESPLYRVEFSNRGGVVRSWKLKKYLTDQKPPRPLDLVNADASNQLGWPFSLVLTDKQLEAQVNSGLYEVTSSATGASADLQAPADVTFHWSDGHVDVVKRLSFTPDYELTVECAVTVDGKAIPAAIACRWPRLART